MRHEFIEPRNSLDECPNCGNHSLAQTGSDKYQCLCCGFYRDISQPEGGVMVFVAAIFFIVLILALLNQGSLQMNELNPPDASNGSAIEVSPN
jgi:ribosomal protein S27E